MKPSVDQPSAQTISPSSLVKKACDEIEAECGIRPAFLDVAVIRHHRHEAKVIDHRVHLFAPTQWDASGIAAAVVAALAPEGALTASAKERMVARLAVAPLRIEFDAETRRTRSQLSAQRRRLQKRIEALQAQLAFVQKALEENDHPPSGA